MEIEAKETDSIPSEISIEVKPQTSTDNSSRHIRTNFDISEFE